MTKPKSQHRTHARGPHGNSTGPRPLEIRSSPPKKRPHPFPVTAAGAAGRPASGRREKSRPPGVRRLYRPNEIRLSGQNGLVSAQQGAGGGGRAGQSGGRTCRADLPDGRTGGPLTVPARPSCTRDHLGRGRSSFSEGMSERPGSVPALGQARSRTIGHRRPTPVDSRVNRQLGPRRPGDSSARRGEATARRRLRPAIARRT